MMGHWCKHYRAMADYDTCNADLPYAPFFPINGVQPPCWTATSTTICPKAVYSTPEEIAAEDAALNAEIKRMGECHNNWVCRHCGADILHEKQIGRCVYAEPCGHRLHQGKARGERPKRLKVR